MEQKKDTSTTQTEQNVFAILQENTEQENNSPSTLVEFRDIIDTPFKNVKQDNKYFAAMGQYKITPDQESFEEVEKFITEQKWEVIFNMIVAITTMLYQPQDEKK